MADLNNTTTSATSGTSANSDKNTSNASKTKKAAQNGKMKKRQKRRKLPLVDQLHEDVCKVLQNCEEGSELQALTYALQPEGEFMECIFEKIMFDIRGVLSQRFRNFEIHPFGSSVCGMAFKSKCKICVVYV